MTLICLLANVLDVIFLVCALALNGSDLYVLLSKLFRWPRRQELMKALAVWALLLLIGWAFAYWGRITFPFLSTSLLWLALVFNPLYEEMARAATISTLRHFLGRRGLATAVAVSTVIFLLRHFSWGPMLTPQFAVLLIFGGIGFGAVYAEARSLPLLFVLHSTWNTAWYLTVIRYQ